MIKNILIIEAGGPAGMSCIKQIRKNFREVKIVAADMDSNSASLKLADISIVVPSSSNPDFPKKIRRIINEYKIDLIMPCFENGFAELSSIPGPFITDFRLANLCKDKLKFNEQCKLLGLPIPKTYEFLLETIPNSFPQYIKPRFGVGSRDNFKAENKDEYVKLFNIFAKNNEFISQDFITGKHWNIDVMADKNGFISSIEREDLKQKDGNCITVKVTTYPKLSEFSRHVQKTLEIGSPFNLEVFETKEGEFIINEINVRFGGGIIFGALAGRDFISYLISRDIKYLGNITTSIYTRYYEEELIKIGD